MFNKFLLPKNIPFLVAIGGAVLALITFFFIPFAAIQAGTGQAQEGSPFQSQALTALQLSAINGLLWLNVIFALAAIFIATRLVLSENPFGSRWPLEVQVKRGVIALIILGLIGAIFQALISPLVSQAITEILSTASYGLFGAVSLSLVWQAGGYISLIGMLAIAAAGVWHILPKQPAGAPGMYPQHQTGGYPQQPYGYPPYQTGQQPSQQLYGGYPAPQYPTGEYQQGTPSGAYPQQAQVQYPGGAQQQPYGYPAPQYPTNEFPKQPATGEMQTPSGEQTIRQVPPQTPHYTGEQTVRQAPPAPQPPVEEQTVRQVPPQTPHYTGEQTVRQAPQPSAEEQTLRQVPQTPPSGEQTVRPSQPQQPPQES
uniref:Uncharacterized protein n=1 Tax=Thermosporothrix sp. COM3 TaxID=2490863 RepID=A0A455SU74_9CHLR|nr:hypothetical protein KTC_54520 [Thermosporothrix sp. COM3]